MKNNIKSQYVLSKTVDPQVAQRQLEKIEKFLTESGFADALFACKGSWKLGYLPLDGVSSFFRIGQAQLAHCEACAAATEAFTTLLQSDVDLAHFIGACQDLIVSADYSALYFNCISHLECEFQEETDGTTGTIQTKGTTEKLGQKFYFRMHSRAILKHPFRMVFLMCAHTLLAKYPEAEAILISNSTIEIKYASGYAIPEEIDNPIESQFACFQHKILFPTLRIGDGMTMARQPFSSQKYRPDSGAFDMTYSYAGNYIQPSDLPWIYSLQQEGHEDIGAAIYSQLMSRKLHRHLQSLPN